MKRNKKKYTQGITKNKSIESRTSKVIVECIDLIKRYRNENLVIEVLKKVNLVIREGEIVAIVGPSGCGKTTLLNCLSGIDDIDGGEVFFEGINIEKLSDGEKTKLRAESTGFVFQSFNLIPVLSTVENVELPLLSNGERSNIARKKALELLRELGLEDKANSKPGQLSGGEQQRVALARALATEPKIIWADEPTGNLDTENSVQIMDLIIDLNKKKGATFVIVTHDVNIAMRAGRIIRMDSGKII